MLFVIIRLKSSSSLRENKECERSETWKYVKKGLTKRGFLSHSFTLYQYTKEDVI